MAANPAPAGLPFSHSSSVKSFSYSAVHFPPRRLHLLTYPPSPSSGIAVNISAGLRLRPSSFLNNAHTRARGYYHAASMSEKEQVDTEGSQTVGNGCKDTAATLLDETLPEDAVSDVISEDLVKVYERCQYWTWKGHKINFVAVGSGPAIVLVHGFGASIGHWRRNIGTLSLHNTVYALDLLGFGGSSKPLKFKYTMETWCQLLLDFLEVVVAAPAVLVGNSLGSLACLLASAEAHSMVRGIVLLNCSGGMNNKAVTDDWRLKLATPLLWIIDLLLQQHTVAAYLFNQLKSKKRLKSILQSVYANKNAVDDELVEIILRPAKAHGALDAFVSIVTGPPGPTPMSLMPRVRNPVLILWGDRDPFTPINGPVGKYFCSLPSVLSNTILELLPFVGHCPHDEQPELVNRKILAWITTLPSCS